jgi:putative ABC transport system substrate-binding protein
VYRVGWLAVGPPLRDSTPLTWPPGAPGPILGRFLDRLVELGYVEGRTLHWEFCRATAADELAACAVDLVERRVDLILILAAPQALRAAFEAPGSTPVVMVASTDDPVGEGYAQSLGRPGGKVTGVTSSSPVDVSGPKKLELLKEVLPALTRLGVLLDVGDESPFMEHTRANLPRNARDQGIELIWAEVRDLEDLDGAFAALARAGAEAVFPSPRIGWTDGEPMVRLFQAALRHGLPMGGWNRRAAEAGALVTYGPDITATFIRAAEYVDKVLRGARPANLPIEQPAHYETVINLKTARALGIAVPPAVIARATEVIQ